MTHDSNANQRVSTAPKSFCITARGDFPDEESKIQLARYTGDYLRELSKHFDLSSLDGVTVAQDYNQALLELDRGFQTEHLLSPSQGRVIGIAMTPAVIRDGCVKSHIVLNSWYIKSLLDEKDPNYNYAIHVLAHECGHVEVTAKFEASFPGFLATRTHETALESLRWGVILPVWDEYAVCAISHGFGEDKTKAYEDIFLEYLATTRDTANAAIKTFRIHGDARQLVDDVYMAYGNLLKYASYHLGTLAGAGISWLDRPVVCEALVDSWFLPFYERLNAGLAAIFDSYGIWTDQSSFEVIGDIVDDMVRQNGVDITTIPGGAACVVVPMTPETTPA